MSAKRQLQLLVVIFGGVTIGCCFVHAPRAAIAIIAFMLGVLALMLVEDWLRR